MTLTPSLQRLLTWLALGVVAFVLLRVFGPALAPIVLAAGVAYLLWPLVLWLQGRGLPRAPAVALSVVAAMVLGGALITLLVPIVTTLIPKLEAQWPAVLDSIKNTVLPWLSGMGIQLDADSLRDEVRRGLGSNVEAWSAKLMASVRIGGSWLLTILSGVVLVPVLVYYLLVDKERMQVRLPTLVPVRVLPSLQSFVRESDVALRRYLRAQLAVMGAMAVFYAAGLSVVGLTLALPIGIFTGLAVFIPYLGYGTGLLLALLTATITFSSWHGVAAVAAVFALGQVLESFFLTPRLVGGNIGLSPLGVIVVLLLFGEAFGFVGVLLSLPASAVGMVALRRLVAWWRASEFFQH
jgi:predicted PurR-regulated permease PerM